MAKPASAGFQLGTVTPSGDHTAGLVVDGQPVALAIQGAGGQSLATWTPSAGSGNRRPIVCSYHAFGATTGTYEFTVDQDTPVTPEPETAYTFMCRLLDGTVVSTEIVVYDPADPFAGALAEERARDAALAALHLTPPQISTNPPADANHLVGLHTWTWHDGPWEPLTETAAVGPVSATVTATPTHITVDPGDGSPTLRCDGPGRPPDARTADSPTPGDCAHQWQHRSTRHDPRGTYPLTVSIEWSIAWQGSTGSGGELDSLTSTSTHPIRVREAQAMLHH
ncbi:MAG: hypothetical protein JJU45_06855 [Acidimicrobiia bacterium]|nr:hypothetical protein [Acidimicrobiia bacterium]